MKLEIVPLTFRQACEFVERHHRHHRPPRGMKFCLGVRDEDGQLCGVALVGRPVARQFDDGRTAEVNRTCTDGTANANSKLYGRPGGRRRRWVRATSCATSASG